MYPTGQGSGIEESHISRPIRADLGGLTGGGRPADGQIEPPRGAFPDGDVGAVGEGKDPGQTAIEALSRAIGTAAIGRFRIIDPATNQLEFSGSVEVTLPSGGTNDAATWGASIEVTGAVTYTPSAV